MHSFLLPWALESGKLKYFALMYSAGVVREFNNSLSLWPKLYSWMLLLLSLVGLIPKLQVIELFANELGW